MKKFFLYVITLVVISCNSEETAKQKKAQIMDTETRFAAMASEMGIAHAFWFFADSNAVIKRQNDTLIHGRDAIKKFYSSDFYKNATVKWSPDFVEVSGDLGYTYGKYVWQSKDSSGKPIEFKGIFHTVWKKQKNSEWKYVWD